MTPLVDERSQAEMKAQRHVPMGIVGAGAAEDGNLLLGGHSLGAMTALRHAQMVVVDALQRSLPEDTDVSAVAVAGTVEQADWGTAGIVEVAVETAVVGIDGPAETALVGTAELGSETAAVGTDDFAVKCAPDHTAAGSLEVDRSMAADKTDRACYWQTFPPSPARTERRSPAWAYGRRTPRDGHFLEEAGEPPRAA